MYTELNLNLNTEDKNLICKVISTVEKILRNGSLGVESVKNKEKIIYTILHIQAISTICCEKGILNPNLNHDLDKICLYSCLDVEEAKALHRKLAKHHDYTSEDSSIILEQVLDWESAHMTKVDKPLSAYETFLQRDLSVKQKELFKEKMQLLGIWKNTGYTRLTESDYNRLKLGISNSVIYMYLVEGYNYLKEVKSIFT